MAWTGDVKYHAGAHRAIKGGAAIDLVVSMPPNPSHLEAVDPVVEGHGARGGHRRVDGGGAPRFDPARSVPILIHGDAAFPGQGVVAETLNLSRLPGYSTGGTIHIIVNNQLGFTTGPEDVYSTSYASGLARGFKIPIVHVNADDPEACVEAARLAFAYRERFQRDFLIDLIGYRRYGHNEGDEPAFTQPLMYQTIASHPTVREIWARTLVERGVLPAEQAERHATRRVWPRCRRPTTTLRARTGSRRARARDRRRRERRRRRQTAVRHRRPARAERGAAGDAGRLLDAQEARDADARSAAGCSNALDERTVDWAAAEELALASILADGTSIRLTGEDVERGTFSHRHAVFHDVKTGRAHVPLQTLPQARAAFEIHNSPLTENAALGFEYGYSVQEPSRLVIWEAQYGDFINGAQVDHRRVPGLGARQVGPAAVARPAAAARARGAGSRSRQRPAGAFPAARRRHQHAGRELHDGGAVLPPAAPPGGAAAGRPAAAHRADAEEPAAPSARRVGAARAGRRALPDGDPGRRGRGAAPSEIRRVICLLRQGLRRPDGGRAARRRGSDVAIVRLEQLYPVPMRDLRAAIDAFPEAGEVVWVQEEPENMGAWDFIRPHLTEVSGGRTGAARRTAAQRQPGRRFGGAARAQPADPDRAGVRRQARRAPDAGRFTRLID